MNTAESNQTPDMHMQQQKKQLAVLLMLVRHAQQHGLAAAQQLARQHNTRLSKEQALQCIAFFEGEEAARQQGQLWDDESMQRTYARAQTIIQTATATLRRQQAQQRWQDMWANVAATFGQMRCAVQDLLNGLIPHQAAPALAAFRGNSDAAAHATSPTIVPSMDLDGHMLYITLRLQQPAHGGEHPPHYSMPTHAEAVLLCIHGEVVTDFELESSKHHITLAIPLNADMAEQIKQQELHLRYSTDLQHIGVWIGTAPDETET